MGNDKRQPNGKLLQMTSESRAKCVVSILIPAYNEERHIERVIASARAALEAVKEASYEVIVCDNNSSDATAELALGAGAAVVFEAHNQIARARNTAARAAGGEWLIFIDADSELPVDLLQATLRRIRSGRVGAGGALIEFDRAELDWHVRFGVWFWNLLSRAMQWAAGSYIFCRREAWEETGGFDEEWYAAEEIAFTRRLKHWCRERDRRFTIVTEARVRTSARKIDSYTFSQMIRLLVGLSLPGALKDRERCAYWYRR